MRVVGESQPLADRFVDGGRRLPKSVDPCLVSGLIETHRDRLEVVAELVVSNLHADFSVCFVWIAGMNKLTPNVARNIEKVNPLNWFRANCD